MTNYVDASAQTDWWGLMQKDIVRPDALLPPAPYPDTSTPPDELLTIKEQPVTDLPAMSPAEQRGQPQTPPQSKDLSQEEVPTLSTSPLLARRHNRPEDFVPRLDLPVPNMQPVVPRPFVDEVPASPPPSALALSPLPEANKRFAGHTPLYAGSPSQHTPQKQPPNHHLQPIVPETLKSLPIHELIVEQDPSEDADAEPQAEEDSQSATPQRDIALTGPLTLAPNPGDGTSENIVLSALDKELDKLARQQELEDGDAESHQPLSRQESAESRTSEPRPVDGVILKKSVPMNFGAPMGEV